MASFYSPLAQDAASALEEACLPRRTLCLWPLHPSRFLPQDKNRP